MISVCIPLYNGEKYLREQLDSILSQLSLNDEIIISDDGSSDCSLEIISSYQDSRIKLLHHKKETNMYEGTYRTIFNVYRNVENALCNSSGDYIFLSDQDDVWLPNKVKRVIMEFEKGQECILHDNIVVDSDKTILFDSYFERMKPNHSFIKLIVKCFYQGASMAFTRNVLDLAIPFPNNPISHDHWIAYNAYIGKFKIEFIKEPLILYRRHGNNVSPSAEKSTNSLFFKISYRFYLLKACLLILRKRFLLH